MFSFPIIYFFAALINFSQPPFEEQVVDNNISIGYGIATGDVDGDGKTDILLADKKQFVWYRNGDWKKFILAENLTAHDNVCIAARDLDGDGKVEIAVGAQWNPSETSDLQQSGSVHYLVRPADPTQLWKSIELPHEPTIHRMKWFKSAAGKFYLLVAPLHGRGNSNGQGEGVQIIAYEFPKDINGKWPMFTLNNNMHLTHNFMIMESADKNQNGFLLAGKEGVYFVHESFNNAGKPSSEKQEGLDSSAGEIKKGKDFIATIEPMHGNKLVLYFQRNKTERLVIDDQLKEGHALAVADFLGTGTEQVVAGWRVPNKDSLTGIRLYKKKEKSEEWESQWLDRNGMACEDMQVADLNQDGKPDIIASGRSTHNLKIYWNRSK